ncbi:PREDICTED: E3 ubiquitin-protein ligase Midline-1-like [Branchiostoma belcheri]|uniref:E3 ubiquitin-protein ligase Midline-1-like n=1 Tax=Branchiostoma belcheri TaxID=7741 RepID=A0A6P4XQV8_BRABE|nr:PREDICTED: E3 ubiquitin-protein ligase Midline-1-like [Branchiostoma belcheri]
MTKAEQNCADIQEQVEAFAQTLTTAIVKRKGILQLKVAVEKDQKLRTLGQQLDQWADTGTGITAAIAEAETLLNEEDPIAFLQASKAVEERIAAFKFLEERKLNTTDQFVHNTLGVSDLEQRVSALDFLQAPQAPRILTDRCTAGRDYININWTAGGNTPVDKYNVWHGKAGERRGRQQTVPSTSKSIKLENLEENTTYEVVVAAINETGQAASQTVDIKTRRGGQLKFKLDKNTAEPPMVVADDGMSVTCFQNVSEAQLRGQAYGSNQGFNQPYQDRLQRVRSHPQTLGFYSPPPVPPCVLGDAAIENGRRYWEVDVRGSSDFGLGVACVTTYYQSLGGRIKQRVSVSTMYASFCGVGPNGVKTYEISCAGMNEVSPGHNSAELTGAAEPKLLRELTKVGVLLDYNAGSISYYDQNHRLITTQAQQISQPVYPSLVVKDQGGTLSLVQDCVWPDGLE